jgi:hypothetical protein
MSVGQFALQLDDCFAAIQVTPTYSRGYPMQTDPHYSGSASSSPIPAHSLRRFFAPVQTAACCSLTGRLCGVEFPVALLDAASTFVSGKDDADVVWASASA